MIIVTAYGARHPKLVDGMTVGICIGQSPVSAQAFNNVKSFGYFFWSAARPLTNPDQRRVLRPVPLISPLGTEVRPTSHPLLLLSYTDEFETTAVPRILDHYKALQRCDR